MKKIMFATIALICIISMFSSCGRKEMYYTFETELGDTLCLEVYLSGNLRGMYPRYLIYDDISNETTNGTAFYVDRTDEGLMPDDPVSNITAVGTYGNHNFYKVFDSLFYYQKGVYMDNIPKSYDVDEYEYDKKDPQMPDFIVYLVQAISDLMKSQNFEYIYKYGEIPASDKDPYMYEMLVRYANGEFSEDEKQINAGSSLTEADMTSFAQYVLEKYYAE